jgi:diadenosine tetraphosphate (Ap4A) HIT family hydrolase
MTYRVTGPPASLLLVHGAGSGPWVYEGWAASFPGVTVAAVDLQEDLDVAAASHAHYASNVADAAAALPAPVSLCGWSMGGLVVLQASQLVRPHSVILLEASPPAEVQGTDFDTEVRDGTFDPEAVYGAFPAGVRARPESARARAERKRGISVPRLPCPSLVIYGDAFRDQRGKAIARVYDSDEIEFPGLDHWGLVLDARVRTGITSWLGATPPDRTLGRRPVDFDAIRAQLAGRCFICEMLGGNPEFRHHVVYEDDRAVAFLNRYPTLYGYVLVAPKEHREQVTGDFSRDEYLGLQAVVHRVGQTVRRVVPTERLYILSLGSQQANRHVHWHIAPLPPGVPFDQQQLAALNSDLVLDLSDHEMADLAARIRRVINQSA